MGDDDGDREESLLLPKAGKKKAEEEGENCGKHSEER